MQNLVHVLRPTLYVLVATDMRVVCPVREVHSLVAEGELVHPLPRTAEDDVGLQCGTRLGESLVGILDATGIAGIPPLRCPIDLDLSTGTTFRP